MKRQQRRAQSHGICLERATIPSSLQARQAALWAIRMAQGKVRNDFLAQSPERFVEITAPHLKWCETSFKRFIFYYEGPEEEREALAQLSPQQAWEHLSSEGDYNTQQAFKAFRKFEPAALNRLLAASQQALDESLASEPDTVQDNVLMLQHLLGFSMEEAVLLHLAAVASQNNAVRSMLQWTTIANESDGTSMLAYLLSVDESAVREAFKQSGMLSNLNFLKRPEVAGDLYELLTLQVWCHACFAETHDSVADLVRHFLEPAIPGNLLASDFPHLANDFSALTLYLQGAMEQRSRGVNLLIYGPPGTGKTAFAKALAQSLNTRLYEVANHFENGEPIHKGERLAFLQMSEKFLAKRKDSLILFDEIEDVFPERFDPTRPSITRRYAATGKAWMNQTLENNQVPVIWISNDIEQMDPAYLRRFSYHLEIRTPPLHIRQAIAQRYLGNTGMRSDFINQLATNTALTPALMENAARVVLLAGQKEAEAAEQLAHRVIRQCQRALGQSSESLIRPHATGYSLDYLNLDSRYSVDRIITALKRKPVSSLCFYGLPGTGKTALAEHVATTLGRPLIARRASDLLSKWLGDAEKNLAAMFEEARAEQAVLLLDEADSFLRNREQAERSWEVSQVNELLQQIERFDGIFICATNLFEQIDVAALRRFAFKIAFKALRPEQRIKLFVQEALDGLEDELNSTLRNRLLQLDNLAPGDFAVVKRQAGLLGETLAPGDFLSELENECRLKPGANMQAMGFLH
ncbi:ATP-binding protein [Quatrionicoccus australiensis]|uniref:ATP-binding protein n=1 Tax=Quatrionicoccus australiensis TaxID=138118 RepID=UPI001CF86D2E|nr:ATP-binding protein [Quatrionicoccus australiensis]UCV16668.1 ATP-binding protein [Quatrionicoccus australiensis]